MTNTPFSFQIFKQTAETFHRELTAMLTDLGIPALSLASDHLCFRVKTLEEYEFYKMSLRNEGTLLTEANVNGRPICTFRLNQPFQTQSHVIPLIELPAPKSGTDYVSGFQHAEFVISEGFQEFRLKHPHLCFQEGGNPTTNPELCLQMKDRQAKFHHQSLQRVIEIEEAKIQDVIFDFDGTLIQSRENIYEINRLVFSEALGRQVTLKESIENFHPEFSKLFEAFAVTCTIKQRQAICNWGVVSEKFSYELFDGIMELLASLRQNGFRLHLWTARDEYSAKKILAHHHLEHFFQTMSFANEKESKPHTKSLRFDWSAASPNEVIVVGDSPTDIIGARNIRAIKAAALWDASVSKPSLIGAGAELFFSHPDELRSWLSSSESIV